MCTHIGRALGLQGFLPEVGIGAITRFAKSEDCRSSSHVTARKAQASDSAIPQNWSTITSLSPCLLLDP